LRGCTGYGLLNGVNIAKGGEWPCYVVKWVEYGEKTEGCNPPKKSVSPS